MRREYGLPSGRRYVRRVMADPANYRRFLMTSIALTPREARYFRKRTRVQELRHRRPLAKYLARHAGVLSVVSLEDDYPRPPYLLVRATGDIPLHRAAIRKRFPLRLKLKRVAYSLRELERAEDSIDEDALRAEGIEVVDSEIGDERVLLGVTTQRTDAAAVVRRMYGPAIRVVVLGPTPTYSSCRSPDSFTLDADGRTLHLAFTDSGSVEDHRVELVERDDEVQVGIVTENPYGPVTADRHPYTRSVTLAAPLGERPVRSITTRRPVRRKQPR